MVARRCNITGSYVFIMRRNFLAKKFIRLALGDVVPRLHQSLLVAVDPHCPTSDDIAALPEFCHVSADIYRYSCKRRLVTAGTNLSRRRICMSRVERCFSFSRIIHTEGSPSCQPREAWLQRECSTRQARLSLHVVLSSGPFLTVNGAEIGT